MKKILFVVPKQSEEYPQYPHTGIGYLSEYLASKGIDSNIVDMRLGYSEEQLADFAAKYKPDFVGVTMVTAGRNSGYRIISFLKSKGYTIVLGGPHVSMLGKKVLEETPVDFAVKCEGEEAIFELLKGKKPETIKNLIFRKNSQIIENPVRPFIKKLDKIPWPKHEKAEISKYRGGGVSIVTSRGCPYSCIYCSAHLGMGRGYRARSPESVIKELKFWALRGKRYFHIVDDNFTLDKARVMKICSLIIKNNIKATFACDGVRADRVDFEVLKKMKEAGVKYLSFGVEGGNNKVLAAIKKGETIEQIEKAIRDSVKLGFEVYLYFLIGSPTETPKDVEDSINLALKYPIAGANFYNLVPFPGTELMSYVQKSGHFIIKPEQYLKDVPYYGDNPVFETKEFTRVQRIRALRRANRIRTLIRRKVLKKRLYKLGISGRLAYPFLKYEFIKDVIVNRFMVKVPILRGIIRKKTEDAFI